MKKKNKDQLALFRLKPGKIERGWWGERIREEERGHEIRIGKWLLPKESEIVFQLI